VAEKERSTVPTFFGLITIVALVSAATTTSDPGEELREAARRGDLAQVQVLLAAGAAVDAPAPRHGHTALIFAAQEGHAEVARFLIEQGADVNARESFFGTTPLRAALYGGHLELARFLLARGATQAADALATAIERGDLELAKAALAGGRIRPLELKAARQQAAAGANAQLQQLLAAARPAEIEPKSIALTREQLDRYAGAYGRSDGARLTVAVRDGELAVTGIGDAELVVQPVAEGLFESAAGDVAIEFGGRAGLIEWAMLNQDGELKEFGAVVSDPVPLKVAKMDGSALESAPRQQARPWPQFRGPGASGIGDGQGAPARWDLKTGANIRFKTKIPGIALSSPILWGDRIFVTTSISAAGDATFRTGIYGDPTSVDDLSEHTFKLYALNASSGAIVWERELFRGRPTVRRHLKSSLANATPATDGERVVVLLGSVGRLLAYDFSGARLWSTEVGVLDCNDPQSGSAEWGHASSPVLYGDLVLVQGDRRKDSFLAAYDLADGRQVWRVPRDEASTWSTPNILRAPSGDELITNGRLVRTYAPKTGELLWTLGPNSEVVVATPVVGDGKAFITAGYPPVRPIYAIRPGHRGDLTLAKGASSSAAIAWSHARGGTYIPTPLWYRGYLYLLNNNGLLSCYRADTGERVYQTRLNEAGASFAASPVAADGRIYFAGETGEVYVLRAGPEFELLTTNAMDEVVMATPAISGGLLVIRTLAHVVGIAEPAAPARAAGME
jgi:outer membrane protein assembly factor BamB